MRLHIEEYNLGAHSYISLTSVRDTDWQRFDAHTLSQWYNWSGLFNGDAVEVALYVAPGDTGVFVSIDQVAVADVQVVNVQPGTVAVNNASSTICGDLDDRVSSNDPRVGRLFFGGCTGWLIANGAVLTAGHCGTPDGTITGVIEFNVPQSAPSGIPVFALLIDQYPVNMNSISFESNGGFSGEDWAVFGLNSNATTGLLAHDVQGFFKVSNVFPLEDVTMRVTGYGTDSGTANVTQQTATGRFDELSGTTLEYEVDTMPGSSGSPVIIRDVDMAIGIHTAGGCENIFLGFENHGTWFGYDPLFQAVSAFTPSGTIYVDAAALFPNLADGNLLEPFSTVTAGVSAVPANGTIKIWAGNYPSAAGNTFVAGADGKAMTLEALLGTVVIGE